MTKTETASAVALAEETTFTSPWLTLTEAAAYAKCHQRTITRWADDGLITRYHVGDLRSVRFRREDLDGLMKPQPSVAADREQGQ